MFHKNQQFLTNKQLLRGKKNAMKENINLQCIDLYTFCTAELGSVSRNIYRTCAIEHWLHLNACAGKVLCIHNPRGVCSCIVKNRHTLYIIIYTCIVETALCDSQVWAI